MKLLIFSVFQTIYNKTETCILCQGSGHGFERSDVIYNGTYLCLKVVLMMDTLARSCITCFVLPIHSIWQYNLPTISEVKPRMRSSGLLKRKLLIHVMYTHANYNTLIVIYIGLCPCKWTTVLCFSMDNSTVREKNTTTNLPNTNND